MNSKLRWLTVATFAIAMAWVESAVVFYLRAQIGRMQPYQPDPLPISLGFGQAELVREAATLVMLLMIGLLAGQTFRSRLAYAAIAFGLWDIFYYIFLIPLTGWPRSLLDWDILFLIPLPWWGPVLAPASIAALLVATGTLVAVYDRPGRPFYPHRASRLLCLAGCALALYAFMADAIRVLPQGEQAVRSVLPQSFLWGPFLVALLLIAAPLFELIGRRLKLASSGLVREPAGELALWSRFGEEDSQ
jgi:hypothetical protein